MPNTSYHLALLMLLCMSGTSNSVRLVLEVKNSFYSKDPIKLQAVDESDHIHEEAEVQFKNSHSWQVAMDSYEQTLKYLYKVKLKTGGGETYVGSFEVFNSEWLVESFSSLDPKKPITILWYVFEECATTKLDPEIGGNTITHRWLKIKFAVLNNFHAEVQLCAESEEVSTVKKETVPGGKFLLWTHFVTSKAKHFTYQLTASRVIGNEKTREIGTVYFFNSQSINREHLEESKTLESWWAVNHSGIQKYNPISGKYRNNIGWLSKSASFHETDKRIVELKKKKKTS